MVEASGLRSACSSCFRVDGLRFKVIGFCVNLLRINGLGFKVSGFWFNLGFGVLGLMF